MRQRYPLSAALLVAMVMSVHAHRPYWLEMSADNPPVNTVIQPRGIAPDNLETVTADEEEQSFRLGHCGDIKAAYGINAGETGMAIKLSAYMLEPYVGNYISGICVATGIDGTQSAQGHYVNALTSCTAFVSEGLDSTPVSSCQGTLSAEGYVWSDIDLGEPVLIEADKDYYVGVIYEGVRTTDYPVVSDRVKPLSDETAYLWSRFLDADSDGNIELQDEYEWKAFGAYVGNMCVKAVISGDELPLNEAIIYSHYLPNTVEPGVPFDYSVLLVNTGSNKVEEIEVSMQIGEQEVQTATCSRFTDPNGNIMDMEYGGFGIAAFEFVCDTEGNNLPVTVSITKVNGRDNKYADRTASGYLMCIGEGFAYNLVLEELTSIHCPASPIGISGLKYMSDKYGASGRVIPISVHSSFMGETDPLNVCDTNDPYYAFSMQLGLPPMTVCNRDMSAIVYPTPENLEELYAYSINHKALVSLDGRLEKSDSDREVVLHLTMKAAMDDDNDYGYAYTIVEDGLGPYMQSNGFAGASDDNYGWESQPSLVELTYDNVARIGSVYGPIKGSIVSGLKKGEKYEYTTAINLSRVSDLKKYRVVAMLVNKQTGVIENSVLLPNPDDTGLRDVSTDTLGTVACGMKGYMVLYSKCDVYTADGRTVARGVTGRMELPSGVYIVTASFGTGKVLVR